MNATIVLADDHTMMRSGLRALLEHQPGIEVVGEAENGRAAVELAQQVHPDVVVMDVNMPDLNGIEATRQIRAHSNGTRVVALSCHRDDRFIREMMRAGASAYIAKESAFEELAAALNEVLAGKVYVGSGLADGTGPADGALAEESPFDRLSSREREVLQLLAEGQSMKEVARNLHISVKTVETHRRNLMEKLAIDNVAGLIKYAIRHGLSSIER